MNYEKIYADFIESRRTLNPKGQVETHHIIPKQLGGSDDQSNLIRLSIDDHFFAHLLLARIHGGLLLASVFLLAGRRGASKTESRPTRVYRMMQRLWGEFSATMPKLVGRDNGMYNHEVFNWVNLDTNEMRSATLSDMHIEFGSSRSSWTSVLTGDKNSLLGWTVNDGSDRSRGLKGRQFTFVNADGRKFVGTQHQFCQHAGVSIATASRICRHGAISADGWSLPTTVKPIPARLNTGALFVLQRDQIVRMMRRKEAAAFLGCTESQFSSGVAYALKHNTPYKGWKVAKAI